MASCSSSTAAREKYEVFLSFRGEDTRDNFTSHLYASLCRKKVKTFIDNELKRGNEISRALSKTIEESKISVIIFSKNYASSKWCLDELENILECKKMNGQMVIPVFYHINPSDVRKQTGSFAGAFAEHEAFFKERTDKVQRWRDALLEVANLSGWDSLVNRPESVLVDKIVGDILEKLSNKPSFDSKGLIGINSRKAIKSLLDIGLSDFCIVGIWGMGGSGKTTIAKAVFNQISWEFEGCCFLANVREESGKRGLVHLREKFISKILGEEIPNIDSAFVKDRLSRTKVFIVLDDVDNAGQLEILQGGIDLFGLGSRIIITTRDKQVLNNFGVYKNNIYEVKGLNAEEALQLFCRHAFKQDQPTEGHMDLSKRVVDCAKGLPLALKVLGSLLYGRSKEQWQDALNKLKRIRNIDIQNVLRISYDGLDEEEKDIFLDIAFFFKGERRAYVERILAGCGFSTNIGISVLIDKSLITISNDHLGMHDLLQEMGMEIVRQQSNKEPGKRSRLWIPEDVHHVLTKNTGTEKVEGIFLDLSKIRKMELSSEAFTRMPNLRILKFSAPVPFDERHVHIPQGLEFLPDMLSYLHWERYPLKSLPSNFNPENLIKLDLRYSHLEQLWNGVPDLVKLKRIDLRHCQNLIGIPDLSQATNLEWMDLEGCTSLLELPSFIGCFHELSYLKLSNCTELKRLPSNISNLNNLLFLYLSGCSNITKFPEVPEEIICLDLNGTAIEEVPLSIGSLSDLHSLSLENCRRLKNLPNSISKLTSLNHLDLNGCSNITKFPEVLGHITTLCLSGTAIEEVPSSLGSLSNLRSLKLENCRSLKNLPSYISNLTSLDDLDPYGCSNITKFPEVSGQITTLRISGAAIEEVPSSLGSLSNLRSLILVDCPSLKNLPRSISNLTSLHILSLSGCSNITKFPEVSETITNLYLNGTAIEEVPSSVGSFFNLISLTLVDCQRLKNLPSGICNLTFLDILDLNGCSNITKFPEVSGYITTLDLGGTAIEEVPPSIECLSELYSLHLNNCTKIKSLPSNIQQLKSLQLLYLSGCSNLKKFPDIPLSIRSLWLDGTGIQEVHSSIKHLSNLCGLYLGNCKSLESLPSSICKLKLLEHIDLTNFSKLDSLPEVLEIFEHLMLNFRPFVEKNKFNSILPGSEIPLWFMHQSMGSSSSIQVPPQWWNSTNLRGLAICVVVGVHENSTVFHDSLDHFPMIWCKNTKGRTISSKSIGIKSNHLWLCFLPRKTLQSDVDVSSSNIKLRFGSNVPGLEVKKCGLHLVYEQDLEEILHGFDKSHRPTKKKEKRSDKSPVEGAIVRQSHENCNCYDEVEHTEWRGQQFLSTRRALINPAFEIMLKCFQAFLVGLLLLTLWKLHSSWLS